MSKKNKNMLDTLSQNIMIKVNPNDELVRVNKIYGLVLSDNTFIIANEMSRKTNYCTIYSLENFFTEKLIKFEVINNYDSVKDIPWGNEGTFSIDDGLVAFSFPIKRLIDKHIKFGLTTKKNILATLKAVNEYMKGNPEFVVNLFNEADTIKNQKKMG